MKSFAEFESVFLAALPQERSDLQGLQGASEAQLSAWVQHIFQQYLGYTHWKEISREGSAPIGSKGSKQLFPDLRIDVLDNGIIFVECKRLGRLDGAKGKEELDDGVSQLKSYIRAHLDKISKKPDTVLGVVTDGNRWHLLGLDRNNEFHLVAEWAFLTDDPQLLAQRFWLLAKPALAQPTSALVEFLARRTLLEVLKENTRWLTKEVNKKLPDGMVSEDLISKWLRDGFSDSASHVRVPQLDTVAISTAQPTQTPVGPPAPVPVTAPSREEAEGSEPSGRRISIADLLNAGLLKIQDTLVAEGSEGRRQTATLTPDGKISVGGQIFDSVSPAALRALELAGKIRKTVNGWSAFRVLRGTEEIGSLLDVRGQFEDKEQELAVAGAVHQDSSDTPDDAVHTAVDQMKPLLGLLPELRVNTSKSTISLYAGNLVVGYAFPRKRGMPRVRVFVGEVCPEWATPDTTYSAWCYVDDWINNVQKVVALLKDAPRRRAEDMTAGRDAYRRRPQPPSSTATSSVG
jgi:Restriction Enzyme Adenine Methylase Associated